MWSPIEEEDDDCYIVSSSDPSATAQQEQTFQRPNNQLPTISTQMLQDALFKLQNNQGISLTTVNPSGSFSLNPERSDVFVQELQRLNSDNNSFPGIVNNPSCLSLTNVEHSILEVSRGMFSSADYQKKVGAHGTRKVNVDRKTSTKKKTVKQSKKKASKKETNKANFISCLATLHDFLQQFANQQPSKRPKTRKTPTKKRNFKSTSPQKLKTPKITKNKKTKRTLPIAGKVTGHRQYKPSKVVSSSTTELSQTPNPFLNRDVTATVLKQSTSQKSKIIKTNPVHKITQNSTEIAKLEETKPTQLSREIIPGHRETIPSTIVSSSLMSDLLQIPNPHLGCNVAATVVVDQTTTQHQISNQSKITNPVNMGTQISTKTSKSEETKQTQLNTGRNSGYRQLIPISMESSSTISKLSQIPNPHLSRNAAATAVKLSISHQSNPIKINSVHTMAQKSTKTAGKVGEHRQSIPSTHVSSSTSELSETSNPFINRNVTATVVNPSSSQHPTSSHTTSQQITPNFLNLQERHLVPCELVSSSTPEPISISDFNLINQTDGNPPIDYNSYFKDVVSGPVQYSTNSTFQSSSTETDNVCNFITRNFADTFSDTFRRIFDNSTEEKIIKMGDLMVLVHREGDFLQYRLNTSEGLSQQELQYQEENSALSSYKQTLKRYQTQFGQILSKIHAKITSFKDPALRRAQFMAWFVKIHLLARRTIVPYPEKYSEGREQLKTLLSQKSLALPLVANVLSMNDEDFENNCCLIVKLMCFKNCF